MSRLVVNPGTQQTWEILLKPGVNLLGRGDANDFRINDPSVSGSHCEILVDADAVFLKDTGSTNGTFVGGSRVQQHQLQDGHGVRLGSVEMIFHARDDVTPPEVDGAFNPIPPPASSSHAPAIRVAIKVPTPPPVSLARSPEPSSMTESAVSSEVGEPLQAAGEIAPVVVGARYCKYHRKSPARFLCAKCDCTYCDMCIQMTEMGGQTARTCRGCGTELTPALFRAAPRKGFYAKLPGAFLYPFKGAGIIILICAAIAFGALNFISGGIFGLAIKVCLYGFIFLFMQNIILLTTSDEADELCFPDVSSLFGGFIQLAGTVLASFWLAIGLSIAKFCGVNIPSEAIIGAVILGGVYFPMALLAVAMKDSVAAANPLVVVPAMLRAPGKYAVTVVLLLAVFGVRQVGNMISAGAGVFALRTHDTGGFAAAMIFRIVWAFLSVYLLTVTMRLLGLFYNGSKQKLGWFKN